jgi:hypothetical protein
MIPSAIYKVHIPLQAFRPGLLQNAKILIMPELPDYLLMSWNVCISYWDIGQKCNEQNDERLF